MINYHIHIYGQYDVTKDVEKWDFIAITLEKRHDAECQQNAKIQGSKMDTLKKAKLKVKGLANY